MQLTESERRLLLDLLDEERARDVRTHIIGRTTATVFLEQTKVYDQLRWKLVEHTPTPEYI